MRRAAIVFTCLLLCTGCSPFGSDAKNDGAGGSRLSDDQPVFENVYDGQEKEPDTVEPRKLGSSKMRFRPPLGSSN